MIKLSDNLKIFTENFTDLFLETELTKTKFAKQIKIGHQKIQHYLDGEIPTTKTIAKICDYFNCSMDYITGLSNEFTYQNIKTGYITEKFMSEYQHLLILNSTNHFKLSKTGIVNESSLGY